MPQPWQVLVTLKKLPGVKFWREGNQNTSLSTHTYGPPAEKDHGPHYPVQKVVFLACEPWASPPPESRFLPGIRKRNEVGVDRSLHAGPGLN